MIHPSLRGVRTIIFDMDGTLIRSGRLAATVLRTELEAFYRRRGVEPPVYTDAELTAGIGLPSGEYYRSLLTEEMKEHWREFRDGIVRGEGTQLARRRITFPGTIATLKALARRGYRLALVSNCSGPYLESVLATQGLAPHFDSALCLDSYRGASKTTLIGDVVEQLGGPAAMVGDRAYDVEGALANGVPAVGALYGYGSREELAETVTWVEDVRDLLRLFDPLRELAEHLAARALREVRNERPVAVALSSPHHALTAPLVRSLLDLLGEEKTPARHLVLDHFRPESASKAGVDDRREAASPGNDLKELLRQLQEGSYEARWKVRRGPRAGEEAVLRGASGSVLLVEGPHLLTPELAKLFDLAFHVQASPRAVSAAIRKQGDGRAEQETARWRTRISPLREAHGDLARRSADVVVNGDRLERGLILGGDGDWIRPAAAGRADG